MKDKIFNKMIEYGWSIEDFEEIYNNYYDFINDILKAIDDLDKGE